MIVHQAKILYLKIKLLFCPSQDRQKQIFIFPGRKNHLTPVDPGRHMVFRSFLEHSSLSHALYMAPKCMAL
jgi:hypothetical protein